MSGNPHTEEERAALESQGWRYMGRLQDGDHPGQYVETYVSPNGTIRVPSPDTIRHAVSEHRTSETTPRAEHLRQTLDSIMETGIDKASTVAALQVALLEYAADTIPHMRDYITARLDEMTTTT